MTLLGFAAVFFLVLANALFVAIEFGLVAVDRNQLQKLAEEGNRSAVRASGIHQRLSYNLSGAQLGITICSLGLGVLAEPVVAVALEPFVGQLIGDKRALGISVLLALLFTTIVQMVVGELIPKSVAVAKPLPTVLALSGAFRGFNLFFSPIIFVCNALAERIVRLFGVEPKDELSSVRSRQELKRLVTASFNVGTLGLKDADLLTRTFRFGEKTAADALTPRVNVQALNVDALVGDLLTLTATTGLSRFVVIEEDLDHVVGVVHIKDVLGVPANDRQEFPIRSLLRDVLAIPESKNLESLIVELQGAAGQFAIVVDEYGGTAGIITLEDVLEEIVGDIDDEHDPQRSTPSVRRWQGAHILSGLLHPDEVLEACKFVVPEGEFETLGGFILDSLGHIPAAGEGFSFDGWTVEVEAMEGRRVATVRLIAPVPETLAGTPASELSDAERQGDR
ncbi:MAG: hemolysin family protein [Microthrixaceae bacterium]